MSAFSTASGFLSITVKEARTALSGRLQARGLTFRGVFLRFKSIMGESVKDAINEQLDKLDTQQQCQVLEFARGLATPAGVSGDKLLQFAGAIAPADLETISRAILEGCEHVDLNAW
jgi:hypothetical protein